MYQSPVPFLIYGPPGTGKVIVSLTVVESVHQILRTQPEAHILLCAPSNPATDTLAQRLGVSLKPGDMLRLNDQNRTFAEVPDPIRQFCYVENDRFALPPWKSLMSYRVVVTSCLDANILVEALLKKHTMMSLHPHRIMKHQIIPHWTHLLIDEAAQGSEPELLVPISVVLTRTDLFDGDQSHSEIPNTTSACYHPLATTPQLCLCGDPNQLGPIITSPEARNYELDLSLLERLFGRPLYAQHPEARHASLPIHQSSVCAPFKPFVNLVKNYRSDPAILMPASALFYNESLEPCASNGLISWQGLSNNKFPVMFLGCDANDESVDERATWFNLGEIEHIFNVITSLMSEASKSFPTLQPEEIGVLAPWREQVWKVREKLRQASLSRVDVGTVEDFQGREKRVVIISCVRSSARFLSEDKQKGIGLVFEKKRMNVAITRAKELLVIIGNGNLLKCDPYWKGFLQFASRNNLYVGPELNIEDDGAWISRLESKFAQVDEENGLATHTGLRNTMMLAGGVVREVLREDF
ncbi:P-loop containing nucleoside triphosphate hydrolase protein [Rhodocollybia butyracea]|uniref:P-loop containing nucleoside triphosphate hydrolase protein n=1 Tax=Rhodocollybia butyracea TaxID=206335 RepID=A0A9P5Q3M4_9AGAR|nr:P-loop containing nucleoside triphosphate hydrolase protein [Rhodocollybia butyracea]